MEGRDTEGLDVFISYSRRDLASAERVRDKLMAAGFGAYLDKHDILPGEPWRERLGHLIEQAGTVVFLLSPDSVASEICDWEVNEAERLGKRLLPVVVRDVPDDRVPGRLKRLNYIFLRLQDDEAAEVGRLSEALQTDIGWVREHARLGVRAAEWQRKQRLDELLLRGSELQAAELWQSERRTSGQSPTDLHHAFIKASRAAEQARTDAERAHLARTRRFQKRAAFALAAVALLVGLGGVAAALLARQTSEREARALTGLAQEAIDAGHFDRAMRIAVHGLPPPGALPFVTVWSQELEAKLAGAALMSLQVAELRGHTRRVTALAISPDGTRVLSASEGGSARVWDLETATAVMVARGEEPGAFHAAVWSPDGRLFATAGGDTQVRLWDAATGQLLHTFRDHSQPVWSVAFSPNGLLLASSGADGKARVWDIASRRQVVVVSTPTTHVWHVEFSPDSETLLTASDTATVWSLPDGRPLLSVKGHTQLVSEARFNRDGSRILTRASDGTARLWDTATGASIAVMTGHTPVGSPPETGPRVAELSGDGRLIATGSHDATVRLWRTGSASVQAVLQSHTGAINAMAFSPDGRQLVSGSTDRRAIVWDVTAQRVLATLAHSAAVVAVAVSADGRLVATGTDDGGVKVWRLGGLIRSRPLPGSAKIEAAAVSRDGRWIAVREGPRGLAIIDTQAADKSTGLRAHSLPVLAFAFDASGRHLISGSFDRTARVWRLDDGREIARIMPSTFPVNAVGISADGRVAATANWGEEPVRVRSWRLADTAGPQTTSPHPTMVASLAFSPDGQTLAMGPYGRAVTAVRLLNAETGEARALLAGHLATVGRVVFDTTGVRMATASADGTVKIWDPRAGRLIHDFAGLGEAAVDVAFDASGDHVAAVTSDGVIHVWQMATGTRLAHMATGRKVLALAIALDGRRIVTVSDTAIHDLPTDWALTARGHDLRERVCRERLRGARIISAGDAQSPFLRDAVGRSPCDHAGPLTVRYWSRVLARLW